MRKTCTKKFRQEIMNTYPGLSSNIRYWNLMRRLLFSQKRDRKIKEVILDFESLAKDECIINPTCHYNALKFLKEFKANVMPDFEWRDYSYENGKARQAMIKWPNNVIRALEEDRKSILKCKNRVYFTTGRLYTRKSAKLQYMEDKENAMKLIITEKWKPALALINYLNSLPKNRFSKILNNLPKAENKAKEIMNTKKQKNQIERLACIQDQPQQFYQFSKKGRTVRIFPLNTGILMLRKEIRKELTKGWYECDLKSSQLAICAKLWGVKSVEKFLMSGKNIWQDLASHFGTILTSDFKKVIKKALYALMFGAAKKTITSELNEKLNSNEMDGYFSISYNYGKMFFSHPLIRELYKARNRRIKEIMKGEIIINAFNEKMRCDGTHNSARSILACEAQAMELYLLIPVIELAIATDEFTITLWQHDGFSLVLDNINRANCWLDRISKAVKQKVKEVGIITELEIAKL